MIRNLLIGAVTALALAGGAHAQSITNPPGSGGGGAPATGAANSVLANPTGSVGVYAAEAMTDCDASLEAVTWTDGAGFGCHTIAGAGGGGATLEANTFTGTQTITLPANTPAVTTAGSITGSSTGRMGFECGGSLNTTGKVLGACLRIAPVMTSPAASDSMLVCVKTSTYVPDCAFGVSTTNTVVMEAATYVYGTLYVNDIARMNSLLRLKSYTVGTLPACAGVAGAVAFVTDATAPAFAAALTGGGSVGVTVYCDGTTWKAG